MKTNNVKRKLASGGVAIGSWLTIPSPFSAERCARLDYDWLIVDMEHSPIGIEKAANMFMAVNQTDTAPLVRVPWNKPDIIKQVLDAGAWGVIVPMVCSKEEAEQAVQSAKYTPQGFRSNGGGRYEVSFDTYRTEYTSQANEETLVVIQIEHIKAVERLDEIFSVPGIDACLIGPNDLMTSMGMLGKMDREASEVKEAFARVVEKANEYGVAPGMHVGSAEEVNRRIDEGFRFLSLSSDMGLMLSKMASERELVKTDR